MLLFITVLLALLLAGALAAFLSVRQDVRQMTATIRRIQGRQTNERLRVSSGGREIRDLANAVNALYEGMGEEKSLHVREMNEMRQSMANISHDLRTPLTSVLGYLKLLEQGGNTPEEEERYLSVACGKAQSLNRLISSLFVLSSLEAGSYRLTLERLDAGEILSEELAGFYEPLTAAGASPRVQLWEGPLWIIGDRDALSRIFSNLLQNMVRHEAKDIFISSALKEGDAVFAFSNRAEDLDEESVSRLFQRFYTADGPRTKESSGLGLSIVKELTQQTGGSIAAALEDGVLTFTLRWKAVGSR